MIHSIFVIFLRKRLFFSNNYIHVLNEGEEVYEIFL